MTTCPKCGYTRSTKDTAPEYECPKCGIVYAKYTKSTDLATTRQRAAQQSLGLPAIFSSRYRRLALFSAACGAIVIIASWGVLHFLGASQDGGLKARYGAYTVAVEKLEFDKAYQYLSPNSKAAVTPNEWRSLWEKRLSLRHTESFRKAEVSADGSSARVFSAIAVDGKDERLNVQTWKKVDGAWYRDFVVDNPNVLVRLKDNTASVQIEVIPKKNAKPAVSDKAKEAVRALEEILSLFDSAEKARRIMGSDELTVSVDQYANALSQASIPIQSYLNSEEAKSEAQMAELIREASLSFELAKVNLESRAKWKMMNFDVWRANPTTANRLRIDADDAEQMRRISSQINNGIDKAKRAKSLVSE